MKTLKVRHRLYAVCEELGIRKKSPHKLRKTYISILLDSGIDRRLVQDVARTYGESDERKKLSQEQENRRKKRRDIE